MNITGEILPEILNAIPEHIAILDEAGTIQAVNAAWTRYTLHNGGSTSDTGIGSNYLQICDQSKNSGVIDAEIVADGLRQLVDGTILDFSHEYPCHTPTEDAWFLVKCWPLPWENKNYSIIFHQDITQPTLLKESLKSQALTDSLCQIANRRHFDVRLKQEWQRDMRNHNPLSLINLDIDHFKAFNDRYGHIAGDECLSRVARTLDSFAQRPGDLAARYGGDEFMLILGSTPMLAAEKIALKLVTAIADLQIPHMDSPVKPHITASVGLTSMTPLKGSSEAALLPLVDRALYLAKEKGRNTIAYHSPA